MRGTLRHLELQINSQLVPLSHQGEYTSSCSAVITICTLQIRYAGRIFGGGDFGRCSIGALSSGVVMNVPLSAWLILLGGVLLMLAVDLFLHKKAHVISMKEAAIWSTIWISLGLAVGVVIWVIYGGEYGAQYMSGYVIEKSLAIDNVFVWGVIFTYFGVERQYQHRVLFLGILGALVFRAIFIALGVVAIKQASWVLYIFGAFLIYSGYKMIKGADEKLDPTETKVYRAFKRLVPMSNEFKGEKFFTIENGKRVATPLLAVLVIIEFMDIVFAVDSIPAVFAVTEEPFIVFSSNALAILGLRAMYFLLADLMHRFIYLNQGLSIVLVWVGVKMIVSHAFFKIPTLLSLGVVVLVITTSIVLSLRATRNSKEVPDHGVES
jgi:tellurite resistance protein TerC